MTDIPTIIHLLRNSDRPVSHARLMDDAAEALTQYERLHDICVKAEANYRGMAGTFSTYGFRASAKEAEETADYIKQVLNQ